MFLAAGIFQHARHTTDLAVLRGAGRDDRAAFAAFAIGAASVAAVPPLAAFWAKDAVLAAAEQRPGWFALALVSAAGTAAYLLRPALILFDPSGRAAPTREAGAARTTMLGGALILAAASLGLGLAGGPLELLLGGEPLPGSALSVALSLAAVALGGAAVLAQVPTPPFLQRLSAAQLHTNTALRALFERPLLALGRLSDIVDRRVVDRAVDGAGRAGLSLAAAQDGVERSGIDAAVDGVARAIGRGGDRASAVQTGRLHEYLRDTVLGAGAVALLIGLTAVT
jgi:NADH-quinone oxidoreductase subunit L